MRPLQLTVSTALFFMVASTGVVRADVKTLTSDRGMIVCVSPDAAVVGAAVLRDGGNAVDAAVAVGFAQAVTHPAAGNIGGGGFMLYAPAVGDPAVIDYRETAPGSVTRTTYEKTTSWLDHRAVGVPGTVRGMEMAHRKFGKLPWARLINPAVQLAEKGFILDPVTARSLNAEVTKKGVNAEFRRVFGKNGGSASWAEGERLVQPDLAKTLQLIADKGADAFYQGPIADQIVAEMKAGDGFITHADLERYQAVARVPLFGQYRGYEVLGLPPPSGGGTVLIEMLNILERFDLRKSGAGSAETRHLMAEAMRRAYSDRARYIGDPAFTKVPNFLIAKSHAAEWARTIDPASATRSRLLATDIPVADEPMQTTHYSIVDRDGNAVSNTYTLEESYGSRVVVRGAGFILNNEMGDFNARPGVTNISGRIGTEPNVPAPGKRMLSSQSPTIIRKDGKTLLVTGSPGGRTITNTVLCVVTNVLDFGMEIGAAVDAPRQHHQWFPDELRTEDRDEGRLATLRKLGHSVRFARQGDAHSIWIDPKSGKLHGAADRRVIGGIAAP